MDVIIDKKFAQSIENNLNKIPSEAEKDLIKIKNLFSGLDINIMGGFVRDSILKNLYGYDFPINDLDILITDEYFEEKVDCFGKENLSRFGGLKFKYNNFSIDIFGINKIYFLNKNNLLDKNLENVLKGVDISTSALAYNLFEDEIYSEYAMEDIYKKEVNILNPDVLDVGATISRLILHADKMNFKIGEKGIKYIRSNYSQNAEKEIRGYLSYKGIEHLHPLIRRSLNSILK